MQRLSGLAVPCLRCGQLCTLQGQQCDVLYNTLNVTSKQRQGVCGYADKVCTPQSCAYVLVSAMHTSAVLPCALIS